MRAPLFALVLAATVPAQKAGSWALAPLATVAVPETGSAWARTPVDRFVLRRLQEKGLTPSPAADRRTLIRRLTFDLHGLPPDPADVDAFVADTRPDAYERLVDRLLASPRYGERWGRHWLDVVRYGETHGYDKDKLRPNAWPYRDWVIEAFNGDMPYARFVSEQLAGDVLRGDPDGIRAAGFIACGPWDFVGHVELREGTVEKRRTRSLDRDDMVAATMAAFASTTAACARCHDHKFDPIPQRDYYRLQAVFAGVERGDVPYEAPPAQRFLTARARTLGYHSAIEKSQDSAKWVQVDLGSSRPIDAVLLFPSHEKYGGHPGPGFGFPPRFKVEVADDPECARSQVIADHTGEDVPHPGDAVQRFAAGGVRGRYVRVTATRLWKRTGDWIFALGEMVVLAGGGNAAAGARVTALDSIEMQGRWGRAYLVDGHARRTGRLVYGVRSREPRPIHQLRRGNVTAEGPLVGAGALSCLPDLEHHFAGLDGAPEGRRRAALARWITDPQNPLTWRSIVNRVWQYHFGRGLVATPNDFGNMGQPPSHPALLDWLAVWFRDGGGSFKRLHRMLVTSAVYRQASLRRDGAAAELDAGNRLLWRMPRQQLDAEALRDAMLAVSGRLDLTMGGPSARWFGFEDDHSPRYDYRAFDPDAPGGQRRSVYRHVVRSVPDPFMECLDCADASVSTPRRVATLTALQALALQNNPFVLRQAEHFAARLQQATADRDRQVEQGFRLALGRAPSAEERRQLVAYAERHGLPALCRLVFNLNEFVFVD